MISRRISYIAIFPATSNSEASHDVRRWKVTVVVVLLTEGLRLAPGPTDKVSGSLAPALPFSSIFRFQKSGVGEQWNNRGAIRYQPTSASAAYRWVLFFIPCCPCQASASAAETPALCERKCGCRPNPVSGISWYCRRVVPLACRRL